MHNGHFPRAIEEAHLIDMSLQYRGGYVSERTWRLAFLAEMVLASESESDTHTEEENQEAA